MSITTEEYNRIVRFLDAEMTLEEMNSFEEELVARPEMRSQLDFEQFVRDGFANDKKYDAVSSVDMDIMPLPNTPTEQSQSTGNFKKINHLPKWIAFAMAASVIGIITTIVLLVSKKASTLNLVIVKDTTPASPKDTNQLVIKNAEIDSSNDINFAGLFKQFFVPDEAPNDKPMYLAEALIDYEAGNYKKLQQLNLTSVDVTRGSEDADEVLILGHYYKGISYLKTDQPAKAISNLQWVLQHNASKVFKDRAYWNLALGYVKSKQPEEAIFQLKKLLSSKNEYQTNAEKLLKALPNKSIFNIP